MSAESPESCHHRTGERSLSKKLPCRRCGRCQHCKQLLKLSAKPSKSAARTTPVVRAQQHGILGATPAISSPSAWRAQMFSAFIEAYFPSIKGGVTPSGWLLKFPQTPDSSTLFPLAMDVLCLSHFGKKDSRMESAAFFAYAKMLATLRHSLQLSSQKWETMDHRMVAASMLALALLDSPAAPKQNNWIVHWDAAYRFISTRGPSFFNLYDPLTEALLREVFQGSLFLGIARRTSLPIIHAEWTKRCLQGRQRGSKECPVRTIYPDDAEIPKIISLADRLLEDRSRPVDAALLDEYVRAATRGRSELRANIDAHVKATSPEKVWERETEAFDLEIEEHCFMSLSKVVQYHYRFPSTHNSAYHACATYARATFYLLILVCTELRLQHFSPTLLASGRLTPWERLTSQAYHLALDLCRTVWQMSVPTSLAIPKWIQLYIEIAQGVFEEQNYPALVGWCQACRVATYLRLERLSQTRPPTLCRIGDLPKGINKIGRYRLWDMK